MSEVQGEGEGRDWVFAILIAGLAVWAHHGAVRFVQGKDQNGLSLMATVNDIIRKRAVEPADPVALKYAAVNGMVSQLDPYSRFFDPKEARAFREGTSGKFGGLGIYITLKRGYITVIAPIVGTPAFQGGVLAGDVIIAIDGVEKNYPNSGAAIGSLKGDPGTKVKLTILHPGAKKPVVLELVRAIIRVQSVRGARLLESHSELGYLRITAFQSDTAIEVAEAVGELVKAGAKGLVIDLRSNPGGLLGVSARIADLFLDRDELIVTTKSRERTDRLLARADASFGTLPLAVLLDGGSASASEILAGALRDQSQAVLVGSRSFGKGSVQSLIDLEGGDSVLKLTTAYYYTPSGRRIHRTEKSRAEDEWGLLPDLPVTMSNEEQLAVARQQGERYMRGLKKQSKGDEVGEQAKPNPASPEPTKKPAAKAGEGKAPVVVDRVLQTAAEHLRAVLAKEKELIPERLKGPVAKLKSTAPVKGVATAPGEEVKK